ncbi:MAG: WXG100 family type VII secretion target [Phototrophicales bacterium]|nr:WXG100 family type VII secretion target [Phototrophicales bacterium]
MADLIQMNYAMVQEMSQKCTQTAQLLQDTMREINQIAEQLDSGVLVGRAGEALTSGLRGRLNPSINRLQDKFREISQDLMGALNDLQSSDRKAGGYFG